MWEEISAIATAVGAGVSAAVLIVTVYQLRKQSNRQNELDERQKKIEEREAYRIELNIKQSLFERRVSTWKIIKTLYLSVEKEIWSGPIINNSKDFAFFKYIDLTNNFYLENIQGALGGMNLDNREWMTNPSIQNNFLKKISEMELLSDEIPLLFSGEESDQVSQFIRKYKDILQSFRENRMMMDSIRKESMSSEEEFEKVAESYNIEEKQKELHLEYNLLDDMYKEIKEKDYINKLYTQIKFTE